jgi:phage terminase large subunit-like protein
MLEAARAMPAFEPDRIVVAVDPPVTGGRGADACGIIVAGVRCDGAPQSWRAEIIADGSVQGVSPQAWAERAVALYHAHGADRLVAEVNQGGDLVKAMIAQVDGAVPIRGVHATRGKATRAEPVAALYEQGRIRRRATFRELENEMTAMTLHGYTGRGSPDRVDALVWAITELMIRPAANGHRDPRIRGL